MATTKAESDRRAQNNEPIAIVGIGCRFPGGADNPAAYWQLLSSGADAICEVPKDRWSIDRFYNPDADKPGKMYVRNGGFIRGPIDRFDAAFFGISPREAIYMDPQQRFLLEVAWEALEDAGIPPAGLAGSNTGVYVGGFTLDSLLLQMSPLNREFLGTHSATGASMTMLANRLSHCLDLRGPSVSMDTACSSSLVAVHFACQALWHGECSTALVGGSNIMLRPEYPVVMCKGHFLAPDGYSKSFDARANGYARGEGVGVVVLKPLSTARLDGDHIYALIRGTGVNQDGRTDGITVPNGDAQEALVRQVYTRNGVPFEDVHYVEAHGTGTPVGDPIEAAVIGRTIGAGRSAQNPCIIGSVKAAIGHLEAAAGVAGLIKASLCLHHRQIPPQANLLEPNPNIPFAELGLRLPRRLEAMPGDGKPVYVGVNSFGYGGTNAHVILEEAPPSEGSRVFLCNNHPQVLTISARDPNALKALASAYAERLSEPDAPALADVCYSAGVRRAHHEHRLAVVANSAEQTVAELNAFATQGRSPSLYIGKAPAKVRRGPVFVFTGMGPQWWDMGRELLESEPVFRRTAHHIDECFQAIAGWSVLAQLQAGQGSRHPMRTEIAQPANFLVQVALAELLNAWKVQPEAIVGHSVGEVSAAYVAGVLNLEDAVCVSYHRSLLQQSVAGLGRMLATGLTVAQAEVLLKGRAEQVSIAAINGFSDVTLSGDPAMLATIAEELTAQEIFTRFLRVEVGYHSPQMDPLKHEMRAALKHIQPRRPTLPIYSTVTGRLVEDLTFDAEYWCDNIREPVRFADSINAILAEGHEAFIEVGPHPVLATSLKDALRRRDMQGVVLSSLRREEPERSALLQGLSGLYVSGYDVDWRAVAGDGRCYVKLPTYAWQRETFWNETPASAAERIGQSVHPLLGFKVPSPTLTWEGELNDWGVPYLKDHVIDKLTVFPGAGYIELGAAIRAQVDSADAGVIEDIEFCRALLVPVDKDPTLRTVFDHALREYSVYTMGGEGSPWIMHAKGSIAAAPPFVASHIDLEDIKRRCRNSVDADALYARLDTHGMQYGAWFTRIQRLWRHSDEVLAELEPFDELKAVDFDYHLHPTLVDAAIQTLIAGREGEGDGRAYLPASINRVSYRRRLHGRSWSYCRITKHTQDSIDANIVICDDDGEVIVEILGLHCKALASSKNNHFGWPESSAYSITWEEVVLENTPTKEGRWLILSDDRSLGNQCSNDLRNHGATEVFMADFRSDSSPFQSGSHHFTHILADAIPNYVVVVLRAPDQAGETSGSGTAHVQFLALLQALSGQAGDEVPRRLYIVTRGAQRVGEEHTSGLTHALTVGLARTALSEFPHLRCTLVDLDPADRAQKVHVHELAEELLSDSREIDVALRGTKRYVRRLTPFLPRENQNELVKAETITAKDADAFRLDADASGRLESLHFGQIDRQPPRPGEVEIRIRAAALNFKDVLKVLGMLPAKALESTFHGTSLGMEAAGVVTAVGEGVSDIQVGDAIVGLMRDSFSSHVMVPVDRLLTMRKLDGMSFEEAASLPVIFITAYYALHEIGRLQSGETVLIHGGAGGVGLAAIQVAQWLGANIIATAGSEEKRAYLRSLGVKHVLNSRTLEFGDQVLALTGGCGADVVLNSLSGEFFLKSLQIVAPFGRFIEIGKRDIVANTRMPMVPFNRNLSFSAIDLDRMMLERPETILRLFREVWERFRAGDFNPTSIFTFPAAQITSAFRYMAQSKQTGKIVISFDNLDEILVVRRPETHALLKPDAAYLITGGLGGFGLEIAKWMADEGARHLVLVGRSGAKSARAQEVLRELKARGVAVKVVLADISKESDVTALLNEIARSGPPLRGVMHAAAVLDDALLANLDAARLQTVIAPKADGAWFLHQHTRGLSIDLFVLFSSVSALLGNPGQGSYVAANTFLDALAHHRRSLGLPATTVNWGALSEVGMAASNSDVTENFARVGIKTTHPAKAAKALGWALERGATQLAIMEVDWGKWQEAYPTTAALPTFTNLTYAQNAEQNLSVRKVRAELLAAEPEKRPVMVSRIVAEIAADTLRIPTDRIDINEQMSKIGIDSLMAVEMQIALNTNFGVEISVLELTKDVSISDVSLKLLKGMGIS